MGATIQAEEAIRVGERVLVESISPANCFGVMFEDDGEAGYFYALEVQDESLNILDALHIYNVASVIDPDKVSVLQVVWSDGGLKAALVINGYPHAVFDFESRRGFCRTNFPSPDKNWTSFGHEWSDAAFDSFR